MFVTKKRLDQVCWIQYQQTVINSTIHQQWPIKQCNSKEIPFYNAKKTMIHVELVKPITKIYLEINLGTFYLKKILIFPKMACKFNAVPFNILKGTFHGTSPTNSKLNHMEEWRPQKTYNNCEKDQHRWKTDSTI